MYYLAAPGAGPSSAPTASSPSSSTGTGIGSNGTTGSTSQALNSTTDSLNATESTSTSYGLPSSVSNGTTWFGAQGAAGTCANETIDATFTGDGYALKAYLTPTPHGDGQFAVGSTICIHTYLENSDNQSASLPSAETVKITSVVNEASSGIIFYESHCSVPADSTGSFGPSSPGWNCVSSWDTSGLYDGSQSAAAAPGTYEAIVTISMADSYEIQAIFSMDLVAPAG